MYILCLVGSLSTLPMSASEQTNEVDAKSMVFHHIQDSYEWHLLSWGDHPIILALPVIVYSTETGWHYFSSSRLSEGKTYEGFRLGTKGKVVEIRPDGTEIRPFDFSLTKTVISLFVNCLTLITIILYTVRWYKHHTPESPAPKGFIGGMEMLIVMLEEDVIRSCIGKGIQKIFALSAHRILLHPHQQYHGAYPGISRRRKCHGQSLHHPCPGTMHLRGREPTRHQRLLERNLLAKCSLMVEGSHSLDASHRIVRYIDQTFCIDDPSVCQHHGRPFRHPGIDKHHLRDRRHGCPHLYVDECRFRSFHHLYVWCRAIGRLHPGVRVHDVICRVHRHVPRRNTSHRNQSY